MNFLAVECCDAGLVASLRADGHDVLYVLENLQGTIDDEVLSLAYQEQRILITEDKDFGELVYRLRRPTVGVILLRFDVTDRRLKIPRMRSLLKNEAKRLEGAFVVLSADKIRIRPVRS
jgi:predicted nuclease of predicted toxin-antitoxin system